MFKDGDLVVFERNRMGLWFNYRNEPGGITIEPPRTLGWRLVRGHNHDVSIPEKFLDNAVSGGSFGAWGHVSVEDYGTRLATRAEQIAFFKKYPEMLMRPQVKRWV